MSYINHILKETQKNESFRNVLFTGKASQLVVMDIKPGEDIGMEKHPKVEQIIFILSGQGKCILDGVESPLVAGDVLIVTPGTEHNVINTGTESLKIYTVYCPPNHIDKIEHKTKKDAQNDDADEAFSESVNS